MIGNLKRPFGGDEEGDWANPFLMRSKKGDPAASFTFRWTPLRISGKT